MFSAKEIKQNILGCFEIFLFMPKGVERFEANRQKAICSFIIPIIMLPFILAIVVGLTEEYPPLLVLSATMVRIIISTVLFLLAVYSITSKLEKSEHFYKFIIVSNWLNINSLVIAFPILIGILLMGVTSGKFEVYAVFSDIVGYIYCAFVVTYCFRIPWELGGFISVVGMAINESLFDLSEHVLGF